MSEFPHVLPTYNRAPLAFERGEGVWAQLYRTRFEKTARANGLGRSRFRLRTDLFTPRQGAQLRLL